MTSQRKFYIEKIALDARNRLIEKKIIDKTQKFLTEEQLEKIVSFFGGDLILVETPEDASIKKTDENKYVIYYHSMRNYLQVIHELGHAFLNFDQMIIGQKYYCNGFGEEDTEAALFARAFVMPRESFEQTVINHLNDGQFCIQNVAKEYNIDYLEVLARGEELNIGK